MRFPMGWELIAVTFSTVDQTIRDTIVETKLLKQYTLLPTLTCMWVQVETCENLFNKPIRYKHVKIFDI